MKTRACRAETMANEGVINAKTKQNIYLKLLAEEIDREVQRRIGLIDAYAASRLVERADFIL